MDTTIIIFLVLSIVVIVLALCLSHIFKKARARDRGQEDLNGNASDASGHATWIGINRSNDDSHYS